MVLHMTVSHDILLEINSRNTMNTFTQQGKMKALCSLAYCMMPLKHASFLHRLCIDVDVDDSYACECDAERNASITTRYM